MDKRHFIIVGSESSIRRCRASVGDDCIIELAASLEAAVRMRAASNGARIIIDSAAQIDPDFTLLPPVGGDVEAELLRINKRLELLSEIASRLLLSENPQEVVQSLCEKVMEFLGCHAFFNYLTDDDRNCLHLNACAGIPQNAARSIEWLDYGAAVCGCAARDGCRIVAENIPEISDPRTDLVKSFGIQAYACHPLLSQGGRVIGTLSFGTRSRLAFADDELVLMKTVADHVASAMERLRLLNAERERSEALAGSKERERQLEAHKRDFYRRTILAATDGKLAISERDEIEHAAGDMVASWRISSLEDITKIREDIAQMAFGFGMEESRVYGLIGCVAEANANAYKHAGGGRASLCRMRDGLLYVVSDSGPGIDALALPDVALTKGYSTAATLGMGYKVMLAFAEKVHLATGPDGTTVAVEVKFDPDQIRVVKEA